MHSNKSFTVEIKQPLNPEADINFINNLESALLLTLLDKQLINREQFERCIHRINK